MADTVDAGALSPAQGEALPLVGGAREKVSRLRERIALGAVLLLSIFMNFFQLGQGSFGNLYYAAGVRSMLDNLHNFFFVAYDPGGFVSVDKPPLGFWLQAISARIFGFTPFSIFFPQALCGVLAVLLLYLLVRRHFGVVAGLLAALALAVMPISVVTNRNNTIDSTLALFLLLAAWAMLRAAEGGKLRWLLLSAVFVGLGFNIKMSEAYLALPALFMAYLLCAPLKWHTRAWHLALFAVVVVVLSLSWVSIVDLTPASQRPYVGSTQNNSAISLATGYNGLNRLRLTGGTSGRGPRAPRSTGSSATQGTQGTQGAAPSRTSSTGVPVPGQATRTATPTSGGNGANPAQDVPAGFVFSEAGTPGVFRLIGPTLGGQIGWLLPLALLGTLALALQQVRWPLNFQHNRQQLGLVLWGLWLLTMATFFTLDSSFHQYYMTELAPGLSAMAGIGLVVMWRDYRAPGWRSWLLPLALILTAVAQIYILASYPGWSSVLSPVVGVLAGSAVLILLIWRLRPQVRLHHILGRAGIMALGLGMLALLIAPTTWSGYSVLRNTESSAPTAGPSLQTFVNQSRTTTGARSTSTRGASEEQGELAALAGAFGFNAGDATQVNKGLIAYLQAHRGNTKYLLATLNAGSASPIILATNEPVMALGGFSGNDPILTTEQLQALIDNGTVRYFLLTSPRATQDLIEELPPQLRDGLTTGGRGGFGQNAALSNWVTTHCQVVASSEFQAGRASARNSLGSNQLYDCAPAA